MQSTASFYLSLLTAFCLLLSAFCFLLSALFNLRGSCLIYGCSLTLLCLAARHASLGVFDPGAWDSQIGAMALLKELMVLDKTITFDRKPKPTIDKKSAGLWTALAAAAGVVAHWLDAHPAISIALFVSVLLLGLLYSRK